MTHFTIELSDATAKNLSELPVETVRAALETLVRPQSNSLFAKRREQGIVSPKALAALYATWDNAPEHDEPTVEELKAALNANRRHTGERLLFTEEGD